MVAVPPQAGKKRQQARTFAHKSRSKTAEQATFALVSEQAGELGSAGQTAAAPGRAVAALALWSESGTSG